jgi:hypothetical protein
MKYEPNNNKGTTTFIFLLVEEFLNPETLL